VLIVISSEDEVVIQNSLAGLEEEEAERGSE
jgi:hypothetical protein